MAFVATLLSCSLGLGPAPATAAPDRDVAVLDLAVVGELPPQWEQALSAALRDGLSRGSFRVIATAPDAEHCSELACLPGETRDASRWVVTARVGVVERMYTLEVALLDARSGESIATASDECDVCGLADVSERVAALGASMREKLDKLGAPPVVRIVSRPDGAEVRIDGERRGTTPFEFTAAPGTYHLELRRPGYVASMRELELVAGVHEQMQLVLEAEPVVTPLPPAKPVAVDRSPRRRTAVGATLVAVGVAAATAGAAAWAIDSRPVRGRCSGTDRDASGECRYLHDTIGVGIGLVTTGITATISGAIVLALRNRVRRSRGRR